MARALSIASASRFTKLLDYRPYPKQREFHRLGATKRERCLMAGNKNGKSYCGGAETAMHLTGIYPEWWEGLRFERPIVVWVGAITNEDARDVVQAILFGREGEWGTGMIPEDRIEEFTWARGISNLVDTAQIRHVSGRNSLLSFKSYAQGRKRWQGADVDFVWCIAEGQRVWMADGRFQPIEQVKIGEYVLAIDGKGRRVERRVLAVHDRGVKPIVEARTSRGPWLRATADHQVFSGCRKKAPLCDAKRLYQLPGGFEAKDPMDLADAFYVWAGLVVSEGSTRCRKITMADGEAVRAAIGCIPIGARVRRHDFNNGHVPDWFLYWPAFWDHIEQGVAHEKKIPDWVFTSSNARCRLFLSYLYAGDGWASGHTVGYASTSRVLAEQISGLLWRLGIRSSIIRRAARDNWRGQWHVFVSSCNAVIRFIDEIGIVGKADAIASVRSEAARRVASKSVRSRHLVTAGESDIKNEFKRRNTRAKERYAKIRSVEPCGESRVFDLTIEDDHCFSVGTAIVSNCDEEPEGEEGAKIYSEALTRTTATGGSAIMTFTPLLGMSEVVTRFFPKPDAPQRGLVQMTIEDAEHIPAERRAAEIAKWPPHEREARARGIPMLGSGRVFPVEEGEIVEEPFEVPRWWPRIGGTDFGWDHPNASAWLAWDRDADVLHLYAEHREREQLVALHAAAINARGEWIPMAWPHDGLVHDKGSGIQLAQQYRQNRVRMIPEHAQFADGSTGLEAGIHQMLERMKTGRWKVFSSCRLWLEEFRMYHRKEGKIVKLRDDLLSASRYALMDLRYARTEETNRLVQVQREYDPLEVLQ